MLIMKKTTFTYIKQSAKVLENIALTIKTFAFGKIVIVD